MKNVTMTKTITNVNDANAVVVDTAMDNTVVANTIDNTVSSYSSYSYSYSYSSYARFKP